MHLTIDNIETHITLLLLLLKVFATFKMRLWYDNENIKEDLVVNIDIRCINCGKTTGLSVKDNNYKDMVNKSFVEYSITLCWFVMDN